MSITSDSYPRRLGKSSPFVLDDDVLHLCQLLEGRWLRSFLTKYWIFVSCGMLLLVSIQNTVVLYRIIYMVFYLFFVLSFQVSDRHRTRQRDREERDVRLDLLWLLEKDGLDLSFDDHHLLDGHSDQHLYLSSRTFPFLSRCFFQLA